MRHGRIAKWGKTSAVILLAMILLCGCSHKRSDVQTYIEETLGITEYSLSAEPLSYRGEDGYTNKLWTVICKDGTIFHVIDHRMYQDGFGVWNRLEDDYPKSALQHREEKG